MGKLDGKIALISGGSSGIGLATAKRFVAEGAYVFITGRREAELNAAVNDIGKNIKALRGDVSKPDDLDRILSAIENDKGRRLRRRELRHRNRAIRRRRLRTSVKGHLCVS